MKFSLIHDFFKGAYLDSLVKEPVVVYLMAIKDGDCYYLPKEFNRLLQNSGIKINNQNKISIAKLIVILISGSIPVTGLDKTIEKELLAFPKINFLAGVRIKETVNGIPHTVKLKVAIDEQIEDRFFNMQYRQFVIIVWSDLKELNKKYSLLLYGVVKLGPWWRR